MLTIVQRGGATHEKPPETVRGQAARLPWAWDGLCFGVPFSDATRDSARDLVAQAAPSEYVGAAWTKDNRGNVAVTLGSSGYVGYPNNPQHDRPTTAVTVYVRLRRAGTIASPRAILGKVHSAGVAPWVTWGMNTADTDVNGFAAQVTVNGTNTFFESTGYLSDTTTWLSLFLRWASGSAAALDVLGERGQPYSSTTNGSSLTGTLTYPLSPQPIRLNTADDPASGSYTANYSQMLVWSRRLTDTELQALVADPYGWYSPRRETIGLSSPYPLVAGQGVMREVPSG